MILRSSPAKREKTTKNKNGRERKRSRRSSSNSGVLFPALVCFVVVVFSLAARCSFEVDDGAILLFPKVFARAASLEEEEDVDGSGGGSSSSSGDGGDKMKAILNVLLERYASRHEGEEMDAEVKRLLFPSSSSSTTTTDDFDAMMLGDEVGGSNSGSNFQTKKKTTINNNNIEATTTKSADETEHISHEERYIDHQSSVEATAMNHDGETDDASHLQKEKERDEKELNTYKQKQMNSDVPSAFTSSMTTTSEAVNATVAKKRAYNYWLDRELDPALGQIAWRAMPGDAYILRAQKRAKENPANLNFQEEFTKAMEIDFPDAEKRAMLPICDSPPDRFDETALPKTMISGNAVCKPRELHATPHCFDCDLASDVSVSASCISHAWVQKSSEEMKYMHMASIVSLKNGDLLASWQQAKEREGDGDQHIALSISKDAGITWSAPNRLFELHSDSARAGGEGPMWGPSMLKDEDGVISLFYSQSSKCRVNPELREDGWNPGGDILMTQSEDGEDWSYPVVLSDQGDGWPLVTANPPVVMRSGSGGTNWALPVWRESPRKSTCDPQAQMQAMKELNPLVNDALSAGVLRGDVSCTEDRNRARRLCKACKHEMSQKGFDMCLSLKCPSVAKQNRKCEDRSWTEQLSLSSNNTWLIEGTIVRYKERELVQFFRTATGKIYRSESDDGGSSWTSAAPIELPNPNSKINAIVLSDGQTAIAYNSHDRQYGLKQMRVNLTVAVSPDRGKNWAVLAQIEEVPGSRAYYASAPINRPLVHYPTMLQRGCHLYVAYSVAFKEWEKKENAEAGIRVARLDLSFARRRCQHSRCVKERARKEQEIAALTAAQAIPSSVAAST
jgi:predicted neuraminidase